MREGIPRPFLKWVGGKRQLLPKLMEVVDAAGPFKHYHEPFLGGGALYFELARAGRLRGRAYLSDINQNLIDAYEGVREDVEAVIRVLNEHKSNHCEAYFYRIRKLAPRTLIERAARIIYLNKTCFNGLYRENRKGEFNAPFGRYSNPNICDEDNLRSVALTLRDTDIAPRDFKVAARLPRRNDLVYFDPPYDPVSKTADFTGYSKGGFDVHSQKELAEVFMRLATKGVKVILSNSLTGLTKDLYENFYISRVFAKRLVNSRADRRGEVPEVLVSSFAIKQPRGRTKPNGVLVGKIGSLERVEVRQWLIANDYEDVARLIDEVVEEWNRTGKQTRRNWWEVLAGTEHGKPRTVAGREFPVLRAARLRQGLPMTPNAVNRSPNERTPSRKGAGRWLK